MKNKLLILLLTTVLAMGSCSPGVSKGNPEQGEAGALLSAFELLTLDIKIQSAGADSNTPQAVVIWYMKNLFGDSRWAPFMGRSTDAEIAYCFIIHLEMLSDFEGFTLPVNIGSYIALSRITIEQAPETSPINLSSDETAFHITGEVHTTVFSTRFAATVVGDSRGGYLYSLDFPDWELYQHFQTEYLNSLQEHPGFRQNRSIFFNAAVAHFLDAMITQQAPPAIIAELQAKWYGYLNMFDWDVVRTPPLSVNMTTELVNDAVSIDTRLSDSWQSIPDSPVWAVTLSYSDAKVVIFIDPTSFACVGYATLYDSDKETETVLVTGPYKYIKIEGGVEICGFMGYDDKNVIVPATLGSYPVITVGGRTFDKRQFIETIEFSDGIINVTCSFYKNYGLKSVIFPKSVEKIGEFFRTSNLERITVDPANQHYCDVDGMLFNKDKTELVYYPEGRTESRYDIPPSVRELNLGAFGYCPFNLKELYIYSIVESIGGSFAVTSFVTFYVERNSAADLYLTDLSAKPSHDKSGGQAIWVKYLD